MAEHAIKMEKERLTREHWQALEKYSKALKTRNEGKIRETTKAIMKIRCKYRELLE